MIPDALWNQQKKLFQHIRIFGCTYSLMQGMYNYSDTLNTHTFIRVHHTLTQQWKSFFLYQFNGNVKWQNKNWDMLIYYRSVFCYLSILWWLSVYFLCALSLFNDVVHTRNLHFRSSTYIVNELFLFIFRSKIVRKKLKKKCIKKKL